MTVTVVGMELVPRKGTLEDGTQALRGGPFDHDLPLSSITHTDRAHTDDDGAFTVTMAYMLFIHIGRLPSTSNSIIFSPLLANS